ncbi:hypothetical protein IMAU40003_00182 [Lactiplantibacillus plantarum]|nr:hypothetical protein [Lactiplantibacillus plantarum]
MKLYVVDRDDSGYDMVDYGIMGIFSTKEKAVDFMRKIDDPKNKYFYEITETNLDNPGKEMFGLSVFMTE